MTTAINTVRKNRVYIKGLNYNTTEEDLEQFFSFYEPLSVLVPSYTVRFRGNTKRVLGIAYAEFGSPEQVDSVIEELSGKVLNGHPIIIKKYSFVPQRKKTRVNVPPMASGEVTEGHRGEFETLIKKVDPKDASSPISRATAASVSEGVQASATTVTGGAVATTTNTTTTSPHVGESISTVGSSGVKINERELSDDTIFISKLHRKTANIEVKEFFNEYSPKRIVVYRNTRRRVSLRSSKVHALVQITVPKDLQLEDILKQLKNKKLNGHVIHMAPAFKSKVTEVIKTAEMQLKNCACPSQEMSMDIDANPDSPFVDIQVPSEDPGLDPNMEPQEKSSQVEDIVPFVPAQGEVGDEADIHIQEVEHVETTETTENAVPQKVETVQEKEQLEQLEGNEPSASDKKDLVSEDCLETSVTTAKEEFVAEENYVK